LKRRQRVLLGLSLGLLASCGRRDASEAPATRQTAAPSSAFKWLAIRPAGDVAPEEFPARLLNTAGSTAVVVPPLPARIVELLVKPGDSLAKNGAIARVIMPDADAAVATVKAAETSLAVLSRRRAQLGSLDSEGLVKASDLAALDLDIARLRGEKMRAEAVLKGAGLASGGLITLRSPLAGVVNEVAATQGELRRPEDGPLARIRSHGGQRIEATLPALPAPHTRYTFQAGREPPLEVELVNIVPRTAGIGYQAWFDAPHAVAMPVASEGRIALRGDVTSETYVVPSSAVGTRGRERFVVVRSRAAPTATVVVVELVRSASSETIVRGPLPEGALVASDPERARAGVAGHAGSDVPSAPAAHP